MTSRFGKDNPPIPESVAARYASLELPPISYDTMMRAMSAIEAARRIVDATGADQFAMTFSRDDGRLAGKISFIDNDFVVDFSLMGQESNRKVI